MKEIQNINHLYDEVREIIASARQNAVRSVDFSRVQMYWQIGRRIQEEEQKGKVFDVVQTGYTLNGKVIRFAKVVVGI